MKKRKGNWYAADFETNNINDKAASIWACGLMKIGYDEDFICFNEFGTFFEYIVKKLKNRDSVWFHNLKFDGSFILYELFKAGYKKVQCKIKDMPAKSFQAMISGMGQWYCITIKPNDKKIIYIKNSLNKLPFKLADIAKSLKMDELKGEIDYLEYREPGKHIITKEEYDYLRRDVKILMIALRDMYYNENLDGLTIGSDCMKEYKKLSESYYDIMFPDIDKYFKIFDQFYKGGLCIVNKNKASSGCVFDYNSMYPSMMHSLSGNEYPVGYPRYCKGAYKNNEDRPLYLQHIRANFEVKQNHIAFIQTDFFTYYKEDNAFIKSSEGEMIDLYLSSVDLEMFFLNYDVFEIEYVDYYDFEARIGLFDNYIDKWYNEKMISNDDPVRRLRAKLFLNNLGGKFGTSVDSSQYDVEGLNDNDELIMKQKDSTRNGVYIPVAIFMTAYARKELITAALKNIDHFCYCDTDSLHLDCDISEVKGLNIDPVALGAWKHESDFEEAVYVKQKTYAEKINKKWEYKAAGMTPELKDIMRIEDFHQGFSTKDNEYYNAVGVLKAKRVKGGTILKRADYSIS